MSRRFIKHHVKILVAYSCEFVTEKKNQVRFRNVVLRNCASKTKLCFKIKCQPGYCVFVILPRILTHSSSIKLTHEILEWQPDVRVSYVRNSTKKEIKIVINVPALFFLLVYAEILEPKNTG